MKVASPVMCAEPVMIGVIFSESGRRVKRPVKMVPMMLA